MNQQLAQPPIRSMGEGIAVSTLVLAVGSFTVIGASAISPLISVSLGLSEVGVGAIASVAYFGALLTAPISGMITDRSGPARMILVGLLTLAVGNLIAGLAWHIAAFYIGIMVAGFGYGAINPATTVLANPASARRRALVMSVKQAGVPAGGIVAGAVLPVLGLALGWRYAFGLSMLICLVVALSIAIRGGYVAKSESSVRIRERQGRRLRLPLGYVFGLLIAGVQVSIFAFTAIYLVDVRGYSTASAGLGVSTLLLGGIFGRLFWGWLSDLFTHHRLLVLEVLGLLGAACLIFLNTASDPLVPAALIMLGICSVGWNGVYIAVVAESSEWDQIGKSTGMSLTLINAGAITVPLVVGALVHSTSSWTVGLLFLAAMSIFATIVCWISSEKFNPQTEPRGSAREPVEPGLG
jgi:MFS family permease